MYELETSHPHIWNDLKSGEFAVNTNSIAFTSIGPDQAQEHLNKVHKGDGAISGITTDPQGLLKYCLSSPELARLAGETEQMLNITKTRVKEHHQHFSAKSTRQRQAMRQLKSVVSKLNPFIVPDSEATENEELNLVNLMTNKIMPASVQRDILNMETRGYETFVTHVKERVNGEKGQNVKTEVSDLEGWMQNCQAQGRIRSCQLESNKLPICSLLLIAKSSREFDLEDIVGKHKFASSNATLMKPDGSLLPSTNKSILIHELECIAATSQTGEEPTNQCSIIIDSMAVVQEMVVYKSQIKTCKDLLDCFVRTTDSKSAGYIDAYVVFDNYSINNSLKGPHQRASHSRENSKQGV